MRKQKKPTGLIIGLALLLSGAFGFNLYQSGMLKNPLANQNTGAPTEVNAKAADLAAQASKAVGGSGETGGKETEQSPLTAEAKPDSRKMAAQKFNQSGLPLIATPKLNGQQPKPNDSATSTQWYTDQVKK